MKKQSLLKAVTLLAIIFSISLSPIALRADDCGKACVSCECQTDCNECEGSCDTNTECCDCNSTCGDSGQSKNCSGSGCCASEKSGNRFLTLLLSFFSR